MALHSFFGAELPGYESVLTRDSESSVHWIDDLKCAFANYAHDENTSRMDACRADFICYDLDKLREGIVASGRVVS